MNKRNLVLTLTADNKENVKSFLRVDPDEVHVPRSDLHALRDEVILMEQSGIKVVIFD
jgi:hypothetical protein